MVEVYLVAGESELQSRELLRTSRFYYFGVSRCVQCKDSAYESGQRN